MTPPHRLRFVLDVMHRLLREGRLSRAWLREVLWSDRHRILAGGDEEAGMEAGSELIDRWLQTDGWAGDLEAIAQIHEAGRIAVELLRELPGDAAEELPRRVARLVTEAEGRLSLPGGMALLALVGGVEHRTARWQHRYVEELLRNADQEMWTRAEEMAMEPESTRRRN